MCKLWYRKQPWEGKKKKDKFRTLVEEALSERVLSLERSRHFSKRARMNMVAYYTLARDGEATTPSDVNSFKKKRKSHTCVLDQLWGCFSRMVNELLAHHPDGE